VTRPRSPELVIVGGRTPAGVAPAAASQTAPGGGDIEVRRGPDGRSRVTRAYATSPLRLLTPRNHGRAAWIYTSSYGGGLVDGDVVAMDVAVGDGAATFVSTQASTKVYRSFRGTESRLRARVGRGGLLIVAPDPVVCFAGARYRQSQTVQLEPDAGLVLVDWVTSGRREAGERWRFEEYVAHTEIEADGRRALYDTVSLRAAHGELESRLGRFDVLALVVMAGGVLVEPARTVIERVEQTPLVRRGDLLMSAAPLRTGGGVVRIAGRSVEQVGRVIERVLDVVPALLGDNPWSRKW
jgi:urease accessory protein